MLKSILMRLARAVLQNILSQLAQQLNIVQEQAMNPVRQIIQSVTDGIWIGEGANAFVDELTSVLVPGIDRVSGRISTLSSNITRAQEVIDRADGEIDSLIKSRLTDAFAFY
jgi:phage-related protein